MEISTRLPVGKLKTCEKAKEESYILVIEEAYTFSSPKFPLGSRVAPSQAGLGARLSSTSQDIYLWMPQSSTKYVCV